MKIVPLNGKAIAPNTAAAIGFFDGVHLAHQALIKRMIAIADERGLKKAVITFDKHPKHVLLDIEYYYLTPFDEKMNKLKTFGVDVIYLIEFDKQKAALDPLVFIEQYLKPLECLVCGFDFTFGLRARGNVDTLKKHAPFETVVIEEQTRDGFKIGSTYIRDLIRGGHVDEVKAILGHYYRIKGTVVHGNKRGRTINYPTANIDVGEYLIPKRGVYATMSKFNGRWHKSMSSIGFNPTLNRTHKISVESYLFDFDKTIYGETIETVFIKRLRDEKKFDSTQALIDAIKEDEVVTLSMLKDVVIDDDAL